MRFFVDADMPRSTLALFATFGHIGEYARDTGFGHAPDSQIAIHARRTGATLITRDMGFADIRHYPPEEYPGILILRMSDDAVAHTITNLLERFLKQTELVSQLPGHLVILESQRVRFRPSLL
jgi:predicted nuclease of predicted toxin-antitoxin system